MKQDPVAKERPRLLPVGAGLPFVLLTSLFFLWAIPNNLTDTMLAAFKRIMSLTDSQTAWIQVVCYLLGYGCFALPAAIYIGKRGYKCGVLLGLAACVCGALLFYPAMYANSIASSLSFMLYLLAILVLFAGLSFLETSANSYVCALGDPRTATRRLNLAQAFNPFGSLVGVIISQVFILSQLHTLSAQAREALSPDVLQHVQASELKAITTTYMLLGGVMLLLFFLLLWVKMPKVKEEEAPHYPIRIVATQLIRKKKYLWAVVAQFFNIGAQISVWSFTIRYCMAQLGLDALVEQVGIAPNPEKVVDTLRGVEPVAASFYNLVEALGWYGMLPQTAEQAAATYYFLSLVGFVAGRFVCTALMKYIKPYKLLAGASLLAIVCSLMVVLCKGVCGVYALVAISACLSLMFPTIYGLGVRNLGAYTKVAGSGMVMAIAGAAVLTQLQAMVSDALGSIQQAYWIPLIAFVVIAYYSLAVAPEKGR